MDYLFITALTVGFLGSFHCLGMCGPFAIMAGAGTGQRAFLLKLLYNFGRVITYTLLGFFAGLAGRSFNLMGWQDDLSVAAGILIILFVLFSNDKLSRYLTGKTVKFSSGLRTALSRLLKKQTAVAMLGLGTVNGLLPCGFVYLALAGATAAGTISGSMTYMLMFGLGTIPMMFGLSIAGSFISNKMRSNINRFSPVIAIALALFLIYRGSQVKTVEDCCKPQHIHSQK
jgi:uncharacterized protein